MAKAFMCDDCGRMFEGVPFKGNPITREEDEVLTVEVFTMRCKKDLCEACATKRLRKILGRTLMADTAATDDEKRSKGNGRKTKTRGAREVTLAV